MNHSVNNQQNGTYIMYHSVFELTERHPFCLSLLYLSSGVFPDSSSQEWEPRDQQQDVALLSCHCWCLFCPCIRDGTNRPWDEIPFGQIQFWNIGCFYFFIFFKSTVANTTFVFTMVRPMTSPGRMIIWCIFVYLERNICIFMIWYWNQLKSSSEFVLCDHAIMPS